MATSIEKQAKAVINSKTVFNHENKKGGYSSAKTLPGNFKPLQSIRSAKESILALTKIAKDLGVERIKHITPDVANKYLDAKRDNFASQKALDRDRKALSIALQLEIPRLKAISDQVLTTRAYSKEQISHITNAMTERNSLSVKIAHNAGLRAHELLTIRRLDEGQKTDTRTWTDDRFKGRSGEVYIVIGKGGLAREVLLSKDLALELEARRFETPKTKADRGVNYLQRYDIGGGNALSASFTRASQRALTFSHGLHGVRHKYAQERLDEIKLRLNVSHDDARDIVAQELGHFRGDITEVYLR
ncbi:site-specific integrase [Shewanella baltica]|uniref:site-specific integrase n=1 Tax=Shewanella baltica TaxID=62322 RepID=UPI00217E77B0|nr:site-specific integrase [Shewanella baltica]MCS6271830.1 site-specific integrase [Shewanella baltica]